MGEHTRAMAIFLVAGIAALAIGLQAQSQEHGRGFPVEDWPFAGGNWSSSRYSTLADITTESVDRLSGAWVTRLDGGASSRATPVVKDGVLYLTAGANIFALDGRNGDTIWRWQPGSSPSEVGMVPSWQGVGLSEELLFVGLGNAQVAALRQDTGELVWAESVGSVPEQDGESVTTAPMYAQGKVFVGLANGDSGGQGRIIALDAQTGRETMDVFYGAATGGVRPRYLAARLRHLEARWWRRLAERHGRSRPRHDLLRHRQPRPHVRGRTS